MRTRWAFSLSILREAIALGIERANVRARQRVAAAWETREGRWGIVSGKALLSALSNWTQSKFGKAVTANALARVLRADELRAEVQLVLGEIEHAAPFPTRKPQLRSNLEAQVPNNHHFMNAGKRSQA